jgi:hypothetical protein
MSDVREGHSEDVGSAMSWWKKLLLVFAAFSAWFFGLICVGDWGYASQYFWTSGCLMAIGFAVSPFWRRRTSVWYWPTVALLIVVNLAVLYAMRAYVTHRDLPSKEALQGLFVIDCMACWALMVGIAYLCERKFPWSDGGTI